MPETAQTTRTEKDSIGNLEIPADAYYGINALRGSRNFPISGITARDAYPAAIKAFGWIKKAAARANMELGMLEPDAKENEAMGKALMQAADELISGKYDDQYIVDVYQGGTGTSMHMNTNEILGNRATELLGGKKGEYRVNPNDHVNYGQSTNDVIPTMMRLTVLSMHTDVMASLRILIDSLNAKSKQFQHVIIPGRTHMQDAVPITFGQVFGAYAHSMEDAADTLNAASQKLTEVGLGANALGTGINTHPDYRKKVAQYLAEYSGFPIKPVRDYFQATSSFGLFATYSAGLRSVAIELEKLAHDLKFYSSGPLTAIAELKLPSLQAGSSIMPGKVNPVIPELMDQLSYAIQGNDLTVALGAQNGQLQLNVMMPIMLLKITESQRLLTNGLKLLATNCIDGLEANTDRIGERLERSTILLTALNPYIGYAQAADVAKKVINEGRTIREVIKTEGITDRNNNPLTEERLNQILSADNMTEPRLPQLSAN